MRSRNTVQIDDLLDVLEFVKNEDVYLPRIKELQETEARLNLKLRIINTLEAAEALVAKHKVTQLALDAERVVVQKEAKELQAKLVLEHAIQMAEIEKKIAENRVFHRSVAEQMNEVREARAALTRDQDQLMKDKQEVGLRSKELSIAQARWKTRVATLQQVLGEQ